MSNMEKLQLALSLGLPLLLLMVAYTVGNAIEKRHFRNIRKREAALKGFPLTTFQSMPPNWHVTRADMVGGSIVVSPDYFKRVIAGLRTVVGGRVKTYEPLLDRARREATLRMAESAKQAGYDAVINVRIETSRLANTKGGVGTAGVEMLAFGTAVSFDQS